MPKKACVIRGGCGQTHSAGGCGGPCSRIGGIPARTLVSSEAADALPAPEASRYNPAGRTSGRRSERRRGKTLAWSAGVDWTRLVFLGGGGFFWEVLSLFGSTSVQPGVAAASGGGESPAALFKLGVSKLAHSCAHLNNWTVTDAGGIPGTLTDPTRFHLIKKTSITTRSWGWGGGWR